MEDISIGNELKDGYKKTNKWVKANLAYLDEIEAFYRQRAAIEREYSEKLSKLAIEAMTKRSNVASTLSVGTEPTMTPGSLECASMVAWKEVLIQTENIAKEKKRFASVIENQVAGELNKTADKYGKIAERWAKFNDETINVRDKNYEDMKKKKAAYDQACQVMENQRSKTMKSGNEKAKEKQKKRESEMNIAKNAYLISISVCNRLKDKYCYQDTPELLDGLQGVNEAKVSKLNSIWLKASELERNLHSKEIEFVNTIDTIVKQNLPRLDTAMFVKHNLGNWNEPPDFQYIPCPVWHDDDTIITDDAELYDLKVRFNDACVAYERYQRLCEDEKQDVEELLVQRNELVGSTFNEVIAKSSESYDKFDDLLGKSIGTLQRFVNDDTRRVIAEVTIETIQSATGDADMSITTPVHKEKKSKFGFLKLDRKNEEEEEEVHEISDAVNDIKIIPSNHKTRIFSSLGNVVTNITDNYNKPANEFFSHPNSNGNNNHSTTATALYPYQIAGDDEIDMSSGENFIVVEADDGSGWTVVKNSSGLEGLVPTSYLKITASAASPPSFGKKQGPKVAPRRGAKIVKKMEILYDYSAQGDDELSVLKGDQIVVLQEDDGSGWTEGELDGETGLLPTSYGRMLS